MSSLILFGGTFDPIHNGHLKIAKEAKDHLGAEKVIFIPAKNPRWKEPISSDDRLRMLELAIENLPDFMISHYEIESNELINYTINTVRHFVRRYPERKIFFLIGFDQVDNLDRWHEIEEIAKLVQIIAVARPGFPRNHSLIKRFDVKVIECEEYDVSSSAIREFLSLDLPKPVLRYIIDHNLYFTKSVQAYMSPKRYDHCVSTAWLSYDVAYANGLDPIPAFIAAYLHDIAKELDNAQERKMMEELYPEYIEYPEVFYHQFLGEYLARTYFKIKDERVLEAIRYHSTGERGIGKYAKILYSCDKIEPKRGYDSSELIKELKLNLSHGFKLTLLENKRFHQMRKDDFNSVLLTQRCLDYYLKGELS